MAERIWSSGGVDANSTVIKAPPRKSMPYFRPPLTTTLVMPATERISEAMIKGHFFPRKSKSVFLNNCIEPCRAGALYNLGHRLFQYVPVSPASWQGHTRAKAIEDRSNTQFLHPPAARQLVVANRLGDENRREHVGDQTDLQGHREPLHRPLSEQEQKGARYHRCDVRVHN